MQKISVVIPCYNGEKYLRESIDSVLTQTHPVHELIVVNDGSTDATSAILESYPEIIVINQANLGIAPALNTGIKSATGNYIAFNDADDTWMPQKLQWQLAEMQKNLQLEAVFGWMENYISPELSDAEKAGILCSPAPLKGFLKGSMLVKREVFDTYGYFDENYRTGDFVEWFSRVKDQGIAYGFVEEVVFKRRLHTTNLSSSPRLGSDFAAILKRRLEAKRKGL